MSGSRQLQESRSPVSDLPVVPDLSLDDPSSHLEYFPQRLSQLHGAAPAPGYQRQVNRPWKTFPPSHFLVLCVDVTFAQAVWQFVCQTRHLSASLCGVLAPGCLVMQTGTLLHSVDLNHQSRLLLVATLTANVDQCNNKGIYRPFKIIRYLLQLNLLN